MDRKILRTLLAGCLLMAVAGKTSVLAQVPTPCDAGRAMEVVARFLDLTEDQRQDFVSILKQSHDDIKLLEEQRRVLRRELDELLDSAEYDLSEVAACAEEIHDLGYQIQDIRKEMIESLLLVLNEEQELKSGIVRRAAALQPVINAYKTLGILPPIVLPPDPPAPPEE
jgi:Spy/CpxP family protein refolding chaperone